MDKRAITVTADDKTRAYGDTNPALTWTVTEGTLAKGDTLTGAMATAATAASGTGGYDIMQGTLAASSNYDMTFEKGTLTVNRRALTITADDLSKTYGDANPTLTWTVTDGSLVNDDEVSGSLATDATAASGVGGYDIVQGTLAASDNYDVTFEAGTLTVNRRAITITADDKARTYGDANPELTWTVTDGSLVEGDTLSGALSTEATVRSGVGGYDIVQGTLEDANYAITFEAGTLTVNQRAITIAADDKSRAYGDANPELTWTITEGDLADGDTLSGALVTDATAATGVGAYDILQGTLDDANYAISFEAGTLTVKKRAITVTADDTSRTYGDANPELTWTVTEGDLVDGDTLSGSLSTEATAASGVGGYAIAQGTLGDANYAVSFEGGTLTVNKRAITVKADDASRTYGDANPDLTWTLTDGELVNDDSLSGSLSTEATATSGVGGYAIAQGSLDNENYAIAFDGGTLMVTKRAITVKADDRSKIYGDANPGLTYAVGGLGLVNGDALTGALATDVDVTTGVGGYDILQGTLAASADYDLQFEGGTLTVAQRAVTIVADDQSRLFGFDNPELTWRIAAGDLVNGDAVAGALSTEAGRLSLVGAYAIGQGTLSLSANYDLSFVGGTLAVTPVPADPIGGRLPPAFVSFGRAGGDAFGNPASIVWIASDGETSEAFLAGACGSAPTLDLICNAN